jgi:hypothetical protein
MNEWWQAWQELIARHLARRWQDREIRHPTAVPSQAEVKQAEAQLQQPEIPKTLDTVSITESDPKPQSVPRTNQDGP